MKPKPKKITLPELEARAREFGKKYGWTEKQIAEAVASVALAAKNVDTDPNYWKEKKDER